MENMHVKEEFREIEGNAGRYSVSNYGMVINNKTGREMVPYYGQNPPTVFLHNGTQRISQPICMLVAKAFVDNPNNYEHVRFIDGDNRHHRADNLEWVESEQEIAIWEK